MSGTRWFLAKHPQGQKRMHREGCRHASVEYGAMRGLDVDDVMDRLTEPGVWAIRWHDGCSFCAPDLRDRIWAWLAATVENPRIARAHRVSTDRTRSHEEPSAPSRVLEGETDD